MIPTRIKIATSSKWPSCASSGIKCKKAPPNKAPTLRATKRSKYLFNLSFFIEIVIAPTKEIRAVIIRKKVNSIIMTNQCFLSFINPIIILALCAVMSCMIPNAVRNNVGTRPNVNKITTLIKRKIVFAIVAIVVLRK